MKTSNRFAVLAGVAAIAFAISSASAQTTTTGSCVFNTNLKVGQRSADVINLQKVLNSNPATSIGNAGKETNFFGPATFAAVKKFQAANDITPVSGFVGALTRAALTKACSTGGSTSTTNVVNTDTPKTTTNNNNVVSNNNIPSVLVAGSARAHIADFTFNGNNIITAVKLQRTGVSNNSVFNNVYLYDGANRVADGVSVSTDGTINWNYTGGLFQVSGSKVISVYADVASGTSGSTAGVALLGYTAQGSSSPVVLSPAIAGPVLSIGSVNLANVSFQGSAVTGGGINTVSQSTVTAGTPGVKVWGESVNVSSNSNGNGVNFTSLTLKTIGSAPQNAFRNYVLKVDGTNVGTPSSLDNNGRVAFNFAPQLLRTGGHTIEVFADNVAGSSRTVQFTLESQGDVTFVDPNVGANVAVTTTGCTQYWTISCAQAGQLTINGGQLVVQADTKFNLSSVIGGAPNQVIGRFIATAYGEDEKVYTFTLTPSLTGQSPAGALGLNNVSLYLNGGQVGTSQNWNGSGSISFNLNSNFVIAAGATATVEVRADTFSNNTNVAYTAGTLSAGTLSGTAYGNGSNGSGASGLTSTINAGSIRSLTLGAAQGSLGLVGATSKTLSPNINGENIGSVTFSAGQNEAVTLNQVNVTLDTSADANGLGLAGLTNITLKNGNNIVGSIYPTAGPVSNLNQPATTLTFSANSITVPVNGSITLDLIADIGNVATNFSVVTNANVQYRGNTSQVTGTSAQTANVTTTFAAAVFTNPTLSGATPLTQFLVGGSTQNVAKFSVKTSTGQTNIQELYFLVNQGGSTLVNSLTFNGVSYPVINNRVTVTGLNLPVNSSAQDISVQANTACFGYTGNCNSNAVTPNSFTVSLTGIKSTQSSVATIGSNGGTALVTGNTMYVVSSKPTVALANSSVGISSGRQQLAQVTVTADSAGSIYVKKLSFNTNISTLASGGATVSNVFLSDDNGNTPLTGFSAAIASVTSGTPYAFTNAAGWTIAPSDSKTFNLWGTLAGSFGTAGQTSISTQLDTNANFAWAETINLAADQTGTPIAGFPTGSYTLKNN